MKTMQKLFAALLVAALVLPVMEGCKKGEEDPAMSFKSRNGRLTGTWDLKSFENTKTTNTSVIRTNDVNDDEFTSSYVTSSTTKYDGNNVTTTFSRTYSSSDKDMRLDFTSGDWEDGEYTEDTTVSGNSSQAWTLAISFYKDNSTEATQVNGNSSYSQSGDWEWADDDPNGNSDDDGELDADGSTTGSATSIEQGTWLWQEGSMKGKLYLDAGVVAGKVLKLSGKELWIEAQFGPLGWGAGEETSDVGTSTDVWEQSLPEYNSAGSYDDGEVTEVTTFSNAESIGIWKFEKSDKASKREGASE